ncbi:type III secretion system cytoplasmic ring protein SctQ [Alcaligenes sp. Marseille-Q7550]
MDAMSFSFAKPVILPRLSAGKAQALTLVAVHGANVRVSLPTAQGAESAPGDWILGLSPGVPDALRQAASHRVDLSWAGASLRVSATPGALLAWVNTRLPGLGLDTLPAVLQEAALETALGEALAALAPLSSSDPLRVAADASDLVLPHAWTFSARSLPGGELALMVLEADDLGLMLLARLLKQANPGGSGVLDDADLSVSLRAELGRAVLPLSELQSLTAADVILLDEYWVDSHGELWLCIPQGQGLRVRAEHSSYLVTQGWTTLMTQDFSAPLDPQPSEPDAPPAEPLELEAIPVRLTFDLGERTLPLSELRQLQPGAVFDLQRPLADGPVMIRANGALLGTGTLVDVDGRIGVCIATLGKVEA